MREIRDLVGEWLEGEGWGDLNLLLRIQESWADIVGEGMGGNTRPYRLESGKLYVGASSHAWVQELHYRREDIKNQLREVYGIEVGEVVAKVINLK